VRPSIRTHAPGAAVLIFSCVHRDSDVNPLAADTDLRLELLEVGPFCIAESGEAVYCSPNATRTQRSGVSDIEYMARSDRQYCESQFARERLTPESSTDVDAIELCRSNLTKRLLLCAESCDTCKAECTNGAARSIVSAYRCSVGLPMVGLTAAFQISDIGIDISSRYGSDRNDDRPAAPSLAWQEQFRTMVDNDIDTPVAPRNSMPPAILLPSNLEPTPM